jgi:O-acetyl-ADP-ribose deacetylase (regulator of RNase III)
MIRIIDGDLLEATEHLIGHQVNCQGDMKSGIGGQVRDKYPNVFEGYKRLCTRKKPFHLLGEVQIVPVSKIKYIANIFGQQYYGRDEDVIYTSYDALYKGLKCLKDLCKKHNKSVALPYNIGCGLANGDWEKVYEMIDEIFKRYEVTLYKRDDK